MKLFIVLYTLCGQPQHVTAYDQWAWRVYTQPYIGQHYDIKQDLEHKLGGQCT